MWKTCPPRRAASPARGAHPSGVGLDRYIRFSDLNEKEKSFLRLQARLSLFNLLDPFLFGFAGLEGEDARWNLRASHHLTSFGGVVNAHLFYKKGKDKFLLTSQLDQGQQGLIHLRPTVGSPNLVVGSSPSLSGLSLSFHHASRFVLSRSLLMLTLQRLFFP